MDILDLIVLIAAGIGAGGYVCRLDSLRVGRHAVVVIVMHLALCVSCILAGYHAWSGDAGALDVAAVVGALAWIKVSLPTWGAGHVPPQFETAHAPLDRAEQ